MDYAFDITVWADRYLAGFSAFGFTDRADDFWSLAVRSSPRNEGLVIASRKAVIKLIHEISSRDALKQCFPASVCIELPDGKLVNIVPRIYGLVQLPRCKLINEVAAFEARILISLLESNVVGLVK
ncbi:hypothetical protein H0H87_005750 [Tephrocybe sp. NHM501043]|nr:hypothetical protein H0H87_005750 [Tephrocybe sp. NHM501043]